MMRANRKVHKAKNIIVSVALIIILMVLMILFSEYSSTLPLRIIISVSIIEYILFRILSCKVDIKLKSDRPYIVREEKVSVSAVINKRSIYPYKKAEFNLKYKSKYGQGERSKRIVLELNDNRIESKKVVTESLPCGYTAFTIENAYIYDILGFGSVSINNISENVNVMVMPTPKPIDIDLPKMPFVSGDESEIFHEDRGRDSSETFEIREFHDGDSMNRIHWKLSSKTDELMIRDSIAAIETNIYVYFDLSKRINIDEGLEKSISIAYEMRNLGYAFYIMWFDKDAWTLRRSLVSEYEHIENAVSEVMKYDMYEVDENVEKILERFMNENHEVYNMFILS